MRIVISVLFCAVVLIAINSPPRASRDHGPVAAGAATMELLVFESARCAYCPLIRRDVLPRYRLSPRAAAVPMRFINLDEIDPDRLNLRQPLTIMPTIILMRDGAEVDRIGGYIGPELFFQAISAMMNRLPD